MTKNKDGGHRKVAILEGVTGKISLRGNIVAARE
jgi:hypothetical protein